MGCYRLVGHGICCQQVWNVGDSFDSFCWHNSRRKFQFLAWISALNASAFCQISTDGFGLLQTQRSRKPYDDFDRNHKWSMIISQSGTIWAPISSVICRWIVGINRAVAKKNLILSFIANRYRDPNWLRSRKSFVRAIRTHFKVISGSFWGQFEDEFEEIGVLLAEKVSI